MTVLIPRRDKLIFDPPEIGNVLYLPGLPGGGPVIFDRSLYGNHGAITGATWTRLPSGLWGLGLDGNDYVDCGNSSILNPTSQMTLMSWVYHNNDLSEDEVWGRWGPDAYVLGVNTANHPFIKFVTNESGQYGIDGAGVFPNQTLCHLATTFKGTDTGITLYLNGSAIVTTGLLSYPETIVTSAAFTVWGNLNRIAGSGYDWNGKLFLGKIFNSCLTATQIANIYQQERHLFGV